MTKVAVVAYPLLGEADRRWIDSTRARYDPQASLIGAHFTLVFPIDADPDAVSAHVRSVVRETAGLLRDHWRRDIPYVPHMTVAAYPALERCEAVAQEVDLSGRVVLGTVTSVDVIDVRAEAVRTVASVRLGQTTTAALRQ